MQNTVFYTRNQMRNETHFGDGFVVANCDFDGGGVVKARFLLGLLIILTSFTSASA
jgi:hypothetical protein